MTEENKRMIMAGVENALDKVPYGKVIIEIRGPNAPTDLVIENRTRYPVDTIPEKKKMKKEYRNDGNPIS